MPRTRYVKPDFFTDEDVARLTPLERILFIGLWTEADRRGRLADKPRTLKVKLLPYDDCDPDAMLEHLAQLGFIQRYEVSGVACIAIPKFEKHQKPHPKEVDLGFPDPPITPRKTAPPPPSREISRQDPEGPATFRNEVKSIPTRPAFNGDGDGDGNPNAPPLRERLDAVWVELRSAPYKWTTADENALRGLITEPPDEVLRRWRIALTTAFPRCLGIVGFAQNWNAYAAPQATAPPRPADKRAPTAANDFTNAKTGTEDWT